VEDRARHVELEASFNFRDLGGYATADGNRVRWASLYRSDSLQWLTANDAEVVVSLGLKTILDLRSSFELMNDGKSTHLDATEFRHTPMFEFDALPFKLYQPGDPQPETAEFYLNLATSCGPAIANAISIIAEDKHPLVFHCAQGKDRTGILAALVLGALGVPNDTIIADYALSERAVDPTFVWADANSSKLAARLATIPSWMLRSSPEFMADFLDGLATRLGSLEAYLASIGIGGAVLAKLRDRLLENPA
jgi:protein-tyrosine phosphatase